ncbi:hypothetical protein Taro_050264 [Colocasia esculenta]|uniref:Disease resistance R13L4/SHOC-2-like LRR domain-containing protein n=1 Tax=Colocasia esculenta TaxID=4460 RepID=A0A843XDM4_COLES|nr:hypothetical protein [Colocasia esculenta]
MNDARGAGQALINKLLDTCLLESGTVSCTVKMHDAVRDMALWINRHEYNKVDGFLARDSIIRREDREHIKRIHLWDNDLEEDARFNPDVILSCSSNRTLLLISVRGLRPPILQGIASGSMKSTLRVLDLSRSDTRGELPAEVGLMAELRFLDLSSTGITSLPKELGNLVKLRQLILRYTLVLEQIPQEAIAGLRSLQVLDMSGSVYDWEADPRGEDGGRQLELGDLEAGLPRLEELHIQLGTPRALERFLNSDKLCSRTRGLSLKRRHRSQNEGPPLYGEGGSLFWRVFSRMGGSLKTLELHGDDAHPWEGGLRISLDQLPLLEDLGVFSFRSERMPEVVLVGSNFTPRSSSSIVRLSEFTMFNCDGLKMLKLVGAFPCLQEIYLGNCSTMEELALDEGVAAGIAEEGTQDDAGLLDRYCPMLRKILNTRGAFLCFREAANRLVHGGRGQIINVTSSVVGSLRPGYAAYTASKAAVEAMTKILAKELRGMQITANSVAPGPVATDMFFAGKSEEDVRRSVNEGIEYLESMNTLHGIIPRPEHYA